MPLRLAEPDAVDDAGMVELVGDDRVFRLKQDLEHAAIRVPAGGVKNGLLGPEKRAEFCLQILVQGLRAADESHRREAVTPFIQCLASRLR